MYLKLTLCAFFISLMAIFISQPSLGLAEEAPTVTAVVAVPELNIRPAPSENSGVWSGYNEPLEIAVKGNILVVHYYETPVFNAHPWVYVTNSVTGVEGWVTSLHLTFSRPDWREVLPHIDDYADLVADYLRTNPTFETYISDNGAPLYARTQPYFGSETVGIFDVFTPVQVLGTARINGGYTFVYVSQNDGQLQGWVPSFLVKVPIHWSEFTWRLPNRAELWGKHVPLLLERDLLSEFATLPSMSITVGTNIRQAPTTQSVVKYPVNYVKIALHGQSSTAASWFYVTVVDTTPPHYWMYTTLGLAGWMYLPNLEEQAGISASNLPLLSDEYQP